MIYLDMDTFLLRDPTERFAAAAEGWDALFARHGDGDCVNIGIFYLKDNSGEKMAGCHPELSIKKNQTYHYHIIEII